MANKWDDFHENMGDENAALHMSGAFDSEVGHDHDPTLPGRGAPIKSTVDQTLAGGANTGTNNQILSWIVRQIKAITGNTNWYDTIAKSFKDILEPDGTTVKEATTGPSSSAGFFYFAGDAPVSGTTINKDSSVTSDTNSWISYGPTGSGATNTWSALNIVPANAKGIQVRVKLTIMADASSVDDASIDISVKFRKFGSSVEPESIQAIVMSPTSGSTDTKSYQDYTSVNIPLSDNKFEMSWNTIVAPGIFNTLKIYLEGWYI